MPAPVYQPRVRSKWGQSKEFLESLAKQEKSREKSAAKKSELSQLEKLDSTRLLSQARQNLAATNVSSAQMSAALSGATAVMATLQRRQGGSGPKGSLRRLVMRSGIDPSLVLFGKNVPGHATHMHLENPENNAQFVRFLRKLQNRFGYRVSEHPAFGGVNPVHEGQAHYENRAADINYGNPGTSPEEQQMLRRLRRLLNILASRS